MGDITDSTLRVIETIIVSGLVAIGGYSFALLKTHRKIDKVRDTKIDKLVSYHEGIPADEFLGLPSVPGLNERLSKQELINVELADRQKAIIEMVQTGNGKTIGQKVDNIEHIASNAAEAAKIVEEKAEHLNILVEDALALQEAHLNDGKRVMEIGVINDEHEWEALRQHGINMPEYVYPPEDLAFSLEDLKNRNKDSNS